MGGSDELVRRRERVVCAGVSRVSDFTVASASGALLTDLDGREYIDFAGGIGVMNVGHCDEEVVRAIREQAGRLLHSAIAVSTCEGYVALCERLVELFPHGKGTKAMLANSGAEAVENAIKIARQATGRPAVLCYTGGFHGRTYMAATLTSKVGYKVGCGPFAPEVYRLPFPVVRPGAGDSAQSVSVAELRRLREAFADSVAPGEVAAIIIELVQGEGGFHVAPIEYVRGLREICDEHGILLILDEVQTGFCRTGRWAAYEHFGVVPDLSVWAKSRGGGMPIAAVLGRAGVMDRVTPGTLGGTYGGNPVACAAALAAIGRMEELGLNARAEQIGERVRARFESIAAQVPQVSDVRGLGAMLAMEFSRADDPDIPDGGLVTRIIGECLGQGLVVIPAGVAGNVLRVLTPLVISDDLLDRALDILESAVLRCAGTPAHAHAKGPSS